MPGRPALPGLCIIRSSLNSSHDICEPRGVMISGTVYDHLQGKLDLPLEFAGERHVKNIGRPIRTYRVRLDWAQEALSSRGRRRRPERASAAGAGAIP